MEYIFQPKKSLKVHELRKLVNKKHRGPLNISLREEYHTVERQLKELLSHKKYVFLNSRLLDLGNTVGDSDNKKFSNCLKSMDDTKGTSFPFVTEDRELDVSFLVTPLKRTTSLTSRIDY